MPEIPSYESALVGGIFILTLPALLFVKAIVAIYCAAWRGAWGRQSIHAVVRNRAVLVETIWRIHALSSVRDGSHRAGR